MYLDTWIDRSRLKLDQVMWVLLHGHPHSNTQHFDFFLLWPSDVIRFLERVS